MSSSVLLYLQRQGHNQSDNVAAICTQNTEVAANNNNHQPPRPAALTVALLEAPYPASSALLQHLSGAQGPLLPTSTQQRLRIPAGGTNALLTHAEQRCKSAGNLRVSGLCRDKQAFTVAPLPQKV
jgi:hypothetical protein